MVTETCGSVRIKAGDATCDVTLLRRRQRSTTTEKLGEFGACRFYLYKAAERANKLKLRAKESFAQV